MTWQVEIRHGRGIVFAVRESRAIVDVGGSKCVPWQSGVKSGVECVSLVVVEGKISRRRRKIRQPAGDGPFSFGDLIGICQMKLAAIPKAWRAQRHFPPADERLLNRQREENV